MCPTKQWKRKGAVDIDLKIRRRERVTGVEKLKEVGGCRAKAVWKKAKKCEVKRGKATL